MHEWVFLNLRFPYTGGVFRVERGFLMAQPNFCRLSRTETSNDSGNLSPSVSKVQMYFKGVWPNDSMYEETSQSFKGVCCEWCMCDADIGRETENFENWWWSERRRSRPVQVKSLEKSIEDANPWVVGSGDWQWIWGGESSRTVLLIRIDVASVLKPGSISTTDTGAKVPIIGPVQAERVIRLHLY